MSALTFQVGESRCGGDLQGRKKTGNFRSTFQVLPAHNPPLST